MERREVNLLRSLQRSWQVAACVAMVGAIGTPAALADSSIENIRYCSDSNWCYYDRDQSRAWRYSPLGQIDTENVSALRPAWIFQPGEVRQGLHGTPIVIDGDMFFRPIRLRFGNLMQAPAKGNGFIYQKWTQQLSHVHSFHTLVV